MTFAVPWIFALGLVAAAAPAIVHWLTRPRPVKLPLSTLRFVREAIRQRSVAHRLRDFIILALRTLAIILLAAAFAGPQWGKKSLITDDAGDAVRVVVLDVSQSMAAADGNTPAIERARSIADRYLQYRPGLRTNLIVAGAQPRAVFENVSTNFEALREELARTTALPQRMDVAAALELAARQLAPIDKQDKRRRELIVVSDFQRTGWGAATFNGLPPETKIQLESIAPREAPANLAIVRAACRPLGARHDRLQLEVVVGNYSSTGRTATVEANIGDGVYRLSGPVAPGAEATLTQEIAAATAAGWLWGGVRLVDADDALANDNSRPLVVELRGEPKYALVSQQPTHLRPSSSHILACALAPEIEPRAPTDRFTRVEPAKLDNQSLADADLVAIDHCGKLSPEHIGLFARQLQRGRPLLYVASEPIDAANIDLIAKQAGIALPIRFAPPRAGTIRSDLRLASYDSSRPPLAAFGDSLPAVVGQLRFAGGLAAERLPAAAQLDDSIRAAFSDGTPALVIARSATGGALAILNADLAASNVWKTGALVPVIEEIVQELLSSDAGDRVFVCGEPLVARIATAGAAQSLRIERTSSPTAENAATIDLGELVDDGDAAVWQWTSPDRPDVYLVNSQAGAVFAAAVAIPAEEADLAALPADVVRDRLAAGRAIHFSARDDSAGQQHDLWKWFAVAVVVCMLAEIGALLAFRT